MGFDAIGGILGGVADIGKIGLGIFQNSQANKIHPEYHAYETLPYAKSELGIAQQLFNGRMAGAADEERNIGASQANYLASAGRNATDSGQLLSLGSLSQGQSNDAYNKLGIEEQQSKYGLLNNLNQGFAAMTAEGDKSYADMLKKYEIDTQQKASLKNSAYSNIFGGAGDIAGGLIQYGNSSGIFESGGTGSTKTDTTG